MPLKFKYVRLPGIQCVTAVPQLVEDEPKVTDLWTVSSVVEENANEELAQILKCEEDQDFFIHLAVIAGNIFKDLFSGYYPEYTTGYIIEGEEERLARFSKYIPNLKDFDFSSPASRAEQQHSDEDSKTEETIDLNYYVINYRLEPNTANLSCKEGKIKTLDLMKLLALCVFFGDHDLNRANVGLIENDNEIHSIKIDPELAFSQAFFNEPESQIAQYCNNIFDTDLFKNYVAYLFNEDPMNDSLDYGVDHPIVIGMLKNEQGKNSFIKGLTEIVSKPNEFFLSRLNELPAVKYETQIQILSDQLKMRLETFRKHLGIRLKEEKRISLWSEGNESEKKRKIPSEEIEDNRTKVKRFTSQE